MDLDKPIDGWLTPMEGIVLTHLAEQCRNGCIVNIGCAFGRSVQYLCERATVPVYAIDLMLTPELIEFRNEVTRKPILIEGDSLDQEVIDMVVEPIELLFIDGDHTVENTSLDILNWVPKVQSGGYVVIHDVFWDQINEPCRCPEVMLAVKRSIDFEDFVKFERLEFMDTLYSRVDTCMIFQKK
jgi:predicted O-methyltransferase YrrM